MLDIDQDVVVRPGHDRCRPERDLVGADEVLMQRPAGEHGPHRKDHQRHRHPRRALVDVAHGVLAGARRAVERHDQQTPGIERGQEGGDGAHPEAIAAHADRRDIRRLEDRVLGPVTGEERHAGDREAADPHADIGDRHLAPDAAHLAHVLLVAHRVDHRSGAQEQQRLEEGVRDEVEDRRLIGGGARGDEHVAELGAGGVGDHTLDVGLHAGDRGGEDARGAADEQDEVQRAGCVRDHRRHARHQEHAGGHHGRGMYQGRDGGRPLHGVRQPGVQADLRRFAHGAQEQQDADDLVGPPGRAQHVIQAVIVLLNVGEDHREFD